jgi:hypothetical protein
VRARLLLRWLAWYSHLRSRSLFNNELQPSFLGKKVFKELRFLFSYLLYILFRNHQFNRSVILVDPILVINSFKKNIEFKDAGCINDIVNGDWSSSPATHGKVLSQSSAFKLVEAGILSGAQLSEIQGLINLEVNNETEIFLSIETCLKRFLTTVERDLISNQLHNLQPKNKYSGLFRLTEAIYHKKAEDFITGGSKFTFSEPWAVDNLEAKVKHITKLISSLSKDYVSCSRYWVYRDMVTCSIDKDGSMGFEDGRHRLYASTVLGYQKIPIMISARHKEWVNKKLFYLGALSRGEKLNRIDAQFLDHPDIEHLKQSWWTRVISKSGLS